jgi:hypothetical protein
VCVVDGFFVCPYFLTFLAADDFFLSVHNVRKKSPSAWLMRHNELRKRKKKEFYRRSLGPSAATAVVHFLFLSLLVDREILTTARRRRRRRIGNLI